MRILNLRQDSTFWGRQIDAQNQCCRIVWTTWRRWGHLTISMTFMVCTPMDHTYLIFEGSYGPKQLAYPWVLIVWDVLPTNTDSYMKKPFQTFKETMTWRSSRCVANEICAIWIYKHLSTISMGIKRQVSLVSMRHDALCVFDRVHGVSKFPCEAMELSTWINWFGFLRMWIGVLTLHLRKHIVDVSMTRQDKCRAGGVLPSMYALIT